MRVLFPGSSPRMRGKRPFMSEHNPAIRLIPAHAGKTPFSLAPLLPQPAHPRACGENRFREYTTRDYMGSSPRMRGKHVAIYLDCLSRGLIPAHAGKTLNDLEF